MENTMTTLKCPHCNAKLKRFPVVYCGEDGLPDGEIIEDILQARDANATIWARKLYARNYGIKKKPAQLILLGTQ